MLKIVPVCGGGSVLKVEGSCCGRAGRLLRFMILVFFTFCTVPSVGATRSVLVVVRVPSAGKEVSSNPSVWVTSGVAASTAAIVFADALISGPVRCGVTSCLLYSIMT